MKQSFVIMTNTICQGDIIGCWTEDAVGNRVPCTFETEVDAWKEIANDMIEPLRQFIAGERSLEDTDFDCADWVVPVDVEDDGSILSEDEVIWKPGQEYIVPFIDLLHQAYKRK